MKYNACCVVVWYILNQMKLSNITLTIIDLFDGSYESFYIQTHTMLLFKPKEYISIIQINVIKLFYSSSP